MFQIPKKDIRVNTSGTTKAGQPVPFGGVVGRGVRILKSVLDKLIRFFVDRKVGQVDETLFELGFLSGVLAGSKAH
jgi:hypothetical protein